MTSGLLIIHDRQDVETRYSGGARLAELWPGARLISTDGLGHRRVLRDESVIEESLRFLAESVGTTR
jgi:pimeloyl-ACP methyl ester carboxylesterase